MAVTCDEVMALLDGIAPFKLAQDWDNAGLLIGRGTLRCRTYWWPWI